MVAKFFCLAAGTAFCGSIDGKNLLGRSFIPENTLLAVWIPRRTSACSVHDACNRSVVLAIKPGVVTPVASVLQAPAGTASIALLACFLRVGDVDDSELRAVKALQPRQYVPGGVNERRACHNKTVSLFPTVA